MKSTEAQSQSEVDLTTCANSADDDNKTSHRVHHLSRLAKSAVIVTRIKQEVLHIEKKQLNVKKVCHFTELFQNSKNANITPAYRLWAAHERIS